MKLETPLSYLVKECEATCVAECCGIAAYDFNPIHIASALIKYRGVPYRREVTSARGQLEALKVNYGTTGASALGVSIDEMNHRFSATELDEWVDLFLANFELALEIVAQFEGTRTTLED